MTESAPRGDEGTITLESHRVHLFRMPLLEQQLLPLFDIPQSPRGIEASACNVSPRWMEGYSADALFVTFEY